MKRPTGIDMKLVEMQNAAMRNEEWHGDVWEEAPWTITLERHPYGTIRMWVAREDKQGHYQNGLCTVYRYEGKIRYSCDYPLAKHVVEKVIVIYKKLEKLGMVQ